MILGVAILLRTSISRLRALSPIHNSYYEIVRQMLRGSGDCSRHGTLGT
jgi:hypothetical protein